MRVYFWKSQVDSDLSLTLVQGQLCKTESALHSAGLGKGDGGSFFSKSDLDSNFKCQNLIKVFLRSAARGGTC